MPNFFILGARRSGTASLAHYLGQHPKIRFIEPRDPAFFQRDELHRLGIDYYIHTFCDTAATQDWLGEASSTYFAYPQIVAPRLRAHYGESPAKFIVLLREPVSRAWSHYLGRVHNGYEKRDFASALAEENLEPMESEARYFGEGCYTQLLKEWQCYFAPENFLLLLTEDLAADPLAQVRRVFRWLDVDSSMPVNVSERLNVARYSRSPRVVEFLNHPPAWLSEISKQIWPEWWRRSRIRHHLRERFQVSYRTLPPLDPAIASVMRRRYRSEVLGLSKVLGRYLSHWLAEDEVVESSRAQMAY
jgi:hypothetical protein